MKHHHFTLMAFIWAVLLFSSRPAQAQGSPAIYLPGDSFSYDDGIATFRTEPGVILPHPVELRHGQS